MSIKGINLKNKVCIVRLAFFKKELQAEYTSTNSRRFLADGGFGCDPDASGTKVFGTWMDDGTRDCVRRGDIESVES